MYEVVVRRVLASTVEASLGASQLDTARASAAERTRMVKVSWTEPLPILSKRRRASGSTAKSTAPSGTLAAAATTERNSTRTVGVKSAELPAATTDSVMAATAGGTGGGEGGDGGRAGGGEYIKHEPSSSVASEL